VLSRGICEKCPRFLLKERYVPGVGFLVEEWWTLRDGYYEPPDGCEYVVEHVVSVRRSDDDC